MNKIIWALGLTIVSSSLSNPAFSQFIDNFDDGDFVRDPQWRGSDSHFAVTEGALTLQAPPVAGLSYLSTPSAVIRDATWEVTVRMDFNPSDANYTRIYLVSDTFDVTAPVYGYYVLAGGRSDDVSLCRQDGESSVKIIDGQDDRLDTSTVEIRIRVTRDGGGNWTLYAGDASGEPALEGSAFDATYSAGSYFGIYCKYTSTRASGFRFDNITVDGKPGEVVQPTEAAFKDVIITEILPDPLPSAGLPEAEFVEVFNRTAADVNLAGWTLSDGTTAARLPPIPIPPQEYAVVTSSRDAPFFKDVRVVPVAELPSLNNSGDAVVLRSAAGVTIDSVRYENTWYRNASKREGGWSLELIDPGNPCGEEDNWSESEAPEGGTPGRQNSVFAAKPDATGPHIVAVTAIGSGSLLIEYNEKLLAEDVPPGNVIIEPPAEVVSVSVGATLRSLHITLSGALEMGTLYTVGVRNIRDCNHNLALEERVPFAVPEEADSLDVVINEILFNPKPGGVDFVEIFNRSRKFINLKGWSTANYSEGTAKDLRLITDRDKLLPPGGFAVLTPDASVLLDHYPSTEAETLVETRLVALPDDAGSVALVDAAQHVIDAVMYNRTMHSIFVTTEDGVSLERLSPDAATYDTENWHSASTHAGGATPGRRNSVGASPLGLPLNAVTVDPPAFRPIYGKPNFTIIRYNFDQAGYVANARILDQQGRCVRSIASNDLLGTEGFYRWDGDRNDGLRARVGSYWLWFEVFSPSGETHTFRERIIVAGDF
ncbi:MAG: lamin tail domain-containing protein [Cyclobacteriaceae bacterium]|nr:lamin tail domain-containing protein [Cyclobacteriaceae bacterium]